MCYEFLENIINITTDENIYPNVTRHDAIVGQFLFWTLHETGHAVFDIYQVPLFGREGGRSRPVRRVCPAEFRQGPGTALDRGGGLYV